MMRRRKLSLIAPALIVALTLSCLAVSPFASQSTTTSTDVIIAKLEELRDEVKTEQPALANKVNAVIHQVEAGAFNGAISKLQNDVKKSILARIDNPEALIKLVDEIIALIKGLAPPPPATPDFRITANPTNLEILQGNSDTANITITSQNGFHQEVTLTNTTTAPLGVKLSLNPSTLTPPSNGSTNSTLGVEVSASVEPNGYVIIVSATNGSLTHSVQIQLKVVATPSPPAKPDFLISANPSTLVIQVGDSDTSAINVTSLEGFNEPVDLAITSEPIQDVDTIRDPTQVTPPANSFAISTLTITVGKAAVPSDNVITIAGTSDGTTRTVAISLQITAETTPPQITSASRIPGTPSYNQSVSVMASVSDAVSGVKEVILNYSHDATTKNVTMTLEAGDYTAAIPALPFATSVNYSVYAQDNAGNWAKSSVYSYVVMDPYPPVIGVPHWAPLTPAANEDVTINVTVTEPSDASGVALVLLLYVNKTTGDWLSTPMTLSDGNWTAVLSNQSDTTVKFIIEAIDRVGNMAETTEQEFVVPPPEAVPLAWILAIILAITAVIGGSAYYIRRQQKKQPAASSSTGKSQPL